VDGGVGVVLRIGLYRAMGFVVAVGRKGGLAVAGLKVGDDAHPAGIHALQSAHGSASPAGLQGRRKRRRRRKGRVKRRRRRKKGGKAV
jgi:hypothetical protein